MAGFLRTLFGKPAVIAVPTEEDWRSAHDLLVFHGLTSAEFATLRELAERLLPDKSRRAGHRAVVKGFTLAASASQAAVMVLNLGYGWYGIWNPWHYLKPLCGRWQTGKEEG